MATTLKQVEQATAVTLMSTELNSLANNSNAAATANLVNTQGTSNTDGYIRGKLELYLAAPSTTVTANTGLSVWFLSTVDGSNFEDGSSSITPARSPDIVLPLRAVSTAQRVGRKVRVPVGTLGILLRNEGTGVTLGATGNTLKLLFNSDQQV